MLVSCTKPIMCLDETNTLLLFKNGMIYNLTNKQEKAPKLSKNEINVKQDIENYASMYEKQYLDTTRLYSRNEKRKIFYSFQSSFFFILVWKENNQITIHPFKDLDTLLFQEGPDEEEVSSMSSALALELGMMQYNPLMKGFLD